jgi:hypothetical protein
MDHLRIVSSNDRPDPLVGALDRAITNVDRALEIANELEVRVRANPDPRPAVHLAIGRDGLFFIAGAATALYVIGVIALAGWVS